MRERVPLIAGIAVAAMLSSSALAQTHRENLWFARNGKSFFLLGANYPWYTGWEGLDLGHLNGNKAIRSIAIWEKGDLQRPPRSIPPGSTGFDAQRIEAQFADMDELGIRVLRWFWGGDGRGFLKLGSQDNCQGIQEDALRHVDEVLAIAQRHRIFLVPVLLDFNFVTGNNHILYEGQSARGGESHKRAIQDPHKRRLLLDRYFKNLAERYKDSPVILYWEIMNEAGDAVRGKDPRTGLEIKGNRCGRSWRTDCHLSFQEMREFLNEAYDAIKSGDPNHPIMPSGLARPRELPLLVGSVKADLFGAHYEDRGRQDGKIQSVRKIRDDLKRKYKLVLDKPLVMTEGPSTLKQHLDSYLLAAYRGGWAGYLPWTYQGLIGVNYFIRRYGEVLTSADADPEARANIEFYEKFRREHVGELFSQ